MARSIAERSLQPRRLDVHHQTAFQAGLYAVLEQRERRHRAVARNHHLAVAHVQRVEGVEKALLGLLLADKELDVVEQQYVGGPVGLAELLRLALADGAYVLGREVLRGGVDERRGLSAGEPSDGVQQVSLAQADLRVDDQGVVHRPGPIGDGLGSAVGELVGLADYEGVEGVLWVQPRAPASRGLGRGCRTRRRVRLGERGIIVAFGGRSARRRAANLDTHVEAAPDLALDRLGDERGHALFEHLRHEGVGRADNEGVVAHGDASRLLQPRLEGGPRYLYLQVVENAFPYLGCR